MRLGVIAVAAMALGACAKDPRSIAPAYVSTLQYEAYDCDQLRQEFRRVETALFGAGTLQSQARSNDVAGVILLGLPVSTLSGDNIAPQIAQLKGQREAIFQVQTAKKCSYPPLPPPGTAIVR